MGGPVSSPFGLRAAPAPPSPLTRPSAERGAQRQTWGVEVRQGQGRARRPQRSAGAAATSTERARTRAERPLTLTGLLAASVRGQGQGRSPPDLPASLPAARAGCPEGRRPFGQGRRPRSLPKPKNFTGPARWLILSSARFSGEAEETTKRASIKRGSHGQPGRVCISAPFGISNRQAHGFGTNP